MISVREAITSVVRVVKRDGFRGLAKRTKIHWADARDCRRFLQRVECDQPTGPKQAVEFAFSIAAIRLFRSSRKFCLAQRVSALQPRTILEVGTAGGGTLFILSRCALPDATIISLDLPAGNFGGGYPIWRGAVYRRLVLPRQTVHLIRGNSHDEGNVARVRSLLAGSPVDVLFIDGDHSYAGVKRDFELYHSLVRLGGFVAFHDIVRHPANVGCQVDRFWAEIRNNYRTEELVENPDQGGKGIGVLWA